MTDKLLLENISNIYKRISHAAVRAGRNPEDINLIAVTKTVSAELIKEAIDAGLRAFGENRVQEAKEKIMSNELRAMSPSLSWHLIGHLQKNKAKSAVELFDMIQSVDSIELVELINKYAEEKGKIQKILVQVKLSDESTKHGILKDNLNSFLAKIAEKKNIRLKGLMTIPPFFEDAEKARPYFRELRELRDMAEAKGFSLPELSMGMSNDFEAAIEEGSTIVRIGTAIFGKRD